MRATAVADDGGQEKGLDAAWNKVAQRMRAEFGDDIYSSWFARMEIADVIDEILIVSVPTRFLRTWINAHYIDRVIALSRKELPKIKRIDIRVRPRGEPVAQKCDPQDPQAQVKSPLVRNQSAVQRGSGGFATTGTGDGQGSPLDHNMTFDGFVAGPSNELAFAAAKRISDTRADAPIPFNPLYIHSKAGMGKTHLLHAISWHIKKNEPQRKVLYLTAERFMYHFVLALNSKEMLGFKDHFRAIDVLLIDDLQFLQGKFIQQEFYHTFNSLVDNNRQVVVAADMPPSELDSLDARMRSRLAGGLVVDIGPTDFDLRVGILNARLAEAKKRYPNLTVPTEVIEYIAHRVTRSGRELEGALTRLVANYELVESVMSVDLAGRILKDLIKSSPQGRIRIDDILRSVGKHYNVTRADLLSPRRARSIVRPRQVGMYLAKQLTSRSLPEIGRRFGGRDHTTVLHAVRKIEELLQLDDKLARDVEFLRGILEQ